MNEMATFIQAGFHGMMAREKMEEEENEIRKAIDQRNKEVEKNLGINLNDPEVIKATTTIQAGFRGFQSRQQLKRPITPAIFIHKPEESEDEVESDEEEYSYIYEDEYDDEDELNERPDTPTSAVGHKTISIGGFTTTFGLRFEFNNQQVLSSLQSRAQVG